MWLPPIVSSVISTAREFIPGIEIERSPKFSRSAQARIFRQQQVAAFHVIENQPGPEHFASIQKFRILGIEANCLVQAIERLLKALSLMQFHSLLVRSPRLRLFFLRGDAIHSADQSIAAGERKARSGAIHGPRTTGEGNYEQHRNDRERVPHRSDSNLQGNDGRQS